MRCIYSTHCWYIMNDLLHQSISLHCPTAGSEAIVDAKYPSGNIYALVPFGISCLIHVPVEVTFSFHVSWLQNEELIPESDTFISGSTSLNSSALQCDTMVKEPVPGEVTYTCEVTGVVNGFTVFQVTQTLPTFSIQGEDCVDKVCLWIFIQIIAMKLGFSAHFVLVSLCTHDSQTLLHTNSSSYEKKLFQNVQSLWNVLTFF